MMSEGPARVLIAPSGDAGRAKTLAASMSLFFRSGASFRERQTAEVSLDNLAVRNRHAAKGSTNPAMLRDVMGEGALPVPRKPMPN